VAPRSDVALGYPAARRCLGELVNGHPVADASRAWPGVRPTREPPLKRGLRCGPPPSGERAWKLVPPAIQEHHRGASGKGRAVWPKSHHRR